MPGQVILASTTALLRVPEQGAAVESMHAAQVSGWTLAPTEQKIRWGCAGPPDSVSMAHPEAARGTGTTG